MAEGRSHTGAGEVDEALQKVSHVLGGILIR